MAVRKQFVRFAAACGWFGVLIGFGMLNAQTVITGTQPEMKVEKWQAPRTAVFDFLPVGVDSSTIMVASNLLRDRLTDTRAFNVVSLPAGARAYTVEAADSVARAVNAEKAVIGSITRIGGKILVTYKLVDVQSGIVDFSDRTTLSSDEDMDAATERIAKAIMLRKSYESTLEVGKVTEVPTQPLARREPYSSILLTTGYQFPLSHGTMSNDPGSMLFNLDAGITYETPDILGKALMGIQRGDHDFYDVHFELLGNKLFSAKDVSPYLGGGLGIHRFSFTDRGGYTAKEDGLSLIADGGVIALRTYYFRVVAEAKADLLLTENYGLLPSVGIHFGLTTPTGGPGGDFQTPSPCIYTALGTFFITGMIIALTNG